MKRKMKIKKTEIKIDGRNFKVNPVVADTMKILKEALQNHEVSLLSWAHVVYNKSASTKEINQFKKTLYKYCMQIPNAEQIIERMINIDKQNKLEKKVETKE